MAALISYGKTLSRDKLPAGQTSITRDCVTKDIIKSPGGCEFQLCGANGFGGLVVIWTVLSWSYRWALYFQFNQRTPSTQIKARTHS